MNPFKTAKTSQECIWCGLVLVFLIAVLIFRNYREKVKTNKISISQKDQIENLLLNILPAEVAKELQEQGRQHQEILNPYL